MRGSDNMSKRLVATGVDFGAGAALACSRCVIGLDGNKRFITLSLYRCIEMFRCINFKKNPLRGFD
jgi:hypothetical protein